MSLRRTPSGPDPGSVPVAPAYLERFVADAHVIVAEGFSRLRPADLASKEEPDISGLIVKSCRQWFDDPGSPEWTKSYFVTEEKHEDRSALQGMKRPRIDIHIETSEPRPRPRFVFEAKRLYRSDSVAEYVGKKGLGALCDGTYAAEAPAAGMLGYVQEGAANDRARQIEVKLGRERRRHGLPARGPVWTELVLDARLGTTRRSRHARADRTPIDIYHSFLKCCA